LTNTFVVSVWRGGSDVITVAMSEGSVKLHFGFSLMVLAHHQRSFMARLVSVIKKLVTVITRKSIVIWHELNTHSRIIFKGY
jgi:hypothetical protein